METPPSKEVADIVHQLKAIASSSITNRRYLIRRVVASSTKYYPQSYLSKLWLSGDPTDREAAMESIFKLDDDHITMEDIFIQIRHLAIKAKGTLFLCVSWHAFAASCMVVLLILTMILKTKLITEAVSHQTNGPFQGHQIFTWNSTLFKTLNFNLNIHHHIFIVICWTIQQTPNWMYHQRQYFRYN